MTNAEFVKYVLDFCIKNKIELKFSTQNEDCTGFFDHKGKPVLYVYVKRREVEWISDLLHEMCHAEQWISNHELYWESAKYTLIDDTKSWVKYSKNDLKHMLRIYRDLELDCEKRAVSYIKDFKLDINLTEYCQSASACIYHYNMMLYYGWNVPSPVQFPEIVESMPKRLKKSYKNTPVWLKNLYLKHYGEPKI